jgi:hypothetical protein
MFEHIRKFLDEFENTFSDAMHRSNDKLTNEEKNIFEYADIHLAEALMKDWGSSDIVAKIILIKEGDE